MCTCRQFCRWLPVLFVLALISWCYFVFTYDILLTLLNNPPADVGTYQQGVAYTIVFNCIFVVGIISFVSAVFTDPGRIPESWVVGAEDTESGQFIPALQTLEVKHDGTRRICRKSKPNVYKPDRAHFCKMLGRCVLKMDHFCPWLNNCIGFYNHKYFYLFIMYMAALTVFMLVAMTPIFVHDVSSMEVRRHPQPAGEWGARRPRPRAPSPPAMSGVPLFCARARPPDPPMIVQVVEIDFTKEFRVTLTYLVLCLLSVGLLCFWGFHTYLLAFNYTTIEFLEKRGCNPPPDHVNRYDVGVWGNITSVLGQNILVWLLPFRILCEGDGLAYKRKLRAHPLRLPLFRPPARSHSRATVLVWRAVNPEWYPAKGR